jgi:hypothetical protein
MGLYAPNADANLSSGPTIFTVQCLAPACLPATGNREKVCWKGEQELHRRKGPYKCFSPAVLGFKSFDQPVRAGVGEGCRQISVAGATEICYLVETRL